MSKARKARAEAYFADVAADLRKHYTREQLDAIHAAALETPGLEEAIKESDELYEAYLRGEVKPYEFRGSVRPARKRRR
jgi:hypothetical protein